ncbi:hypothetical protein LUZ61_020419 [Rhynchospora tenuis]|uniref:Uncharacterized protein n=1 Tax=Rhynchospora tenuis TaxID=198213 RepID=A0AAD5ZCZ7_9POAL|nr:hypothetical protein LUZ61_020419 [Rhynchospora tenuis]
MEASQAQFKAFTTGLFLLTVTLHFSYLFVTDSHSFEREAMENLTANEIAGFGIGVLLLYSTISASKVDSFIASFQRRSLGMCKRCGDLKMIACSNCKGVGSIRKGSNFFSNMVDDFFESFGDIPKPTPMVPCTKCRSKGHTACPECSITTRVIQ